MANQETKTERDVVTEYPLVISLLREDIQDLKSDLREIRNKIDELRGGINELRDRVDNKIYELRKDMNKMLVWIIGTMVAIAGVIIAVVKL